jgi:hypothetical protein
MVTGGVHCVARPRYRHVHIAYRDKPERPLQTAQCRARGGQWSRFYASGLYQLTEQELRKQFETVTDLRSEIKALQADNLKLYEKVRYVNTYRDGPNSVAGPSGSSGSGGGMLSGVMAGRRDEEMGRYKDKYEESMNPFEAFKGRVSLPPGLECRCVKADSGQEAQRAISALNPMDKAVFALTRAIIGNKRARSFFVIYTAGLVSTLSSQVLAYEPSSGC